MTEKDATTAATPKKGKSTTKARKPKTAPSHPKVSEMVNSAIKSLKERSGSSLQAIKKYIAANYKVDAEKLSPFIKKYLKSAVISGGLVQTKGKGASGSFRMSGPAPSGTAKSSAKKTATKPKSAKTAAASKKVAKPKKTPQSKPKKASPAKKSKPVAKAAVKKAKPAAKKKPARASPKKKAASKKAKK